MAAVSESRFHGLRRPGASLLVKKGLPSRPNEPVLSRKAVNASASTVDTSASPKITSPSSFRSPTSTDERNIAAKPLPSPPEARNNEVVRPPRGSSLSPQAPEESRPLPKAVADLQLPQASPVRPVSEALSISQFIPEPEEAEEQPPQQSVIPNGISGNFRPGSEETLQTNGDDATTITAPYMPPIPDPVVTPPLTKVHYGCYQSHRAMPASDNVWYATACMTCHKIDQEIRRRCIFCCLRICTDCFETLQKGRDRSLGDLMARLSRR